MVWLANLPADDQQQRARCHRLMRPGRRERQEQCSISEWRLAISACRGFVSRPSQADSSWIGITPGRIAMPSTSRRRMSSVRSNPARGDSLGVGAGVVQSVDAPALRMPRAGDRIEGRERRRRGVEPYLVVCRA
jgi:hypothetical protein